MDEIGEAVVVTTVEGKIPDDFPEGVYIRNGQQYNFPEYILKNNATCLTKLNGLISICLFFHVI